MSLSPPVPVPTYNIYPGLLGNPMPFSPDNNGQDSFTLSKVGDFISLRFTCRRGGLVKQVDLGHGINSNCVLNVGLMSDAGGFPASWIGSPKEFNIVVSDSDIYVNGELFDAGSANWLRFPFDEFPLLVAGQICHIGVEAVNLTNAFTIGLSLRPNQYVQMPDFWLDPYLGMLRKPSGGNWSEAAGCTTYPPNNTPEMFTLLGNGTWRKLVESPVAGGFCKRTPWYAILYEDIFNQPEFAYDFTKYEGACEMGQYPHFRVSEGNWEGQEIRMGAEDRLITDIGFAMKRTGPNNPPGAGDPPLLYIYDKTDETLLLDAEALLTDIQIETLPIDNNPTQMSFPIMNVEHNLPQPVRFLAGHKYYIVLRYLGGAEFEDCYITTHTGAWGPIPNRGSHPNSGNTTPEQEAKYYRHHLSYGGDDCCALAHYSNKDISELQKNLPDDKIMWLRFATAQLRPTHVTSNPLGVPVHFNAESFVTPYSKQLIEGPHSIGADNEVTK